MKIILHWIILSVSVVVASKIMSGIRLDPLWVAFTVGASLTLFNMFIKPIINVLTLPLNLITLGFFSLIVNAILLWYLATIIKGFSVDTFYAAFVGALLVSFTNWILKKIFHF